VPAARPFNLCPILCQLPLALAQHVVSWCRGLGSLSLSVSLPRSLSLSVSISLSLALSPSLSVSVLAHAHARQLPPALAQHVVSCLRVSGSNLEV